jgi:hypothetical protein
MSILNNVGVTKTFTLDLEQIKQLVVLDLGYTPKNITIDKLEQCVSSDCQDRYAPTYVLSGLRITTTD